MPRKIKDDATVDIPGAFVQADMVGDLHVKLEGKIAELLANAYDNYMHMENDKISHVCEAPQGHVWHPPGSPTFSGKYSHENR